ncbi:hypothetical protein CDL15_Pgr026136 [Punica granatum]|uniref:Uncharacterized protein n=1 Tax=Punica granatum TaxID=22663 RepID=A0A218WC97_PUNGR|nr:hypothetical protein CDL15_Pgr026136 [Punica granatum]
MVDPRAVENVFKVMGKLFELDRSMEAVVDESRIELTHDLVLVMLDSIAICAFTASKERKKDVGIFDLMKKHKYRVGADTINCLLDAPRRAKPRKGGECLVQEVEGEVELWREMESREGKLEVMLRLNSK